MLSARKSTDLIASSIAIKRTRVTGYWGLVVEAAIVRRNQRNRTAMQLTLNGAPAPNQIHDADLFDLRHLVGVIPFYACNGNVHVASGRRWDSSARDLFYRSRSAM